MEIISHLFLCSYGPISSSKAIIDQKSGECKGYGFAMFEDQNDCQVAINGLNAAGFQASLARVGQVKYFILFLTYTKRTVLFTRTLVRNLSVRD